MILLGVRPFPFHLLFAEGFETFFLSFILSVKVGGLDLKKKGEITY